MEAARAQWRKIFLPILVDDVEIPMEFSQHHWVDLRGWDGNSLHHQLDYLLDSVKIYLQRPQAVGPPEQVPAEPSSQPEHEDTPEASSPQPGEVPEATSSSEAIARYLRLMPKAYAGKAYYRVPPANVLMVGPGEYMVEIDLPGFSPDQLEVQIESSSLIISGVRRLTYYVDEPQYLIAEREGMRFLREFKFPVDLTGARIEHNYMDGVLKLRLSL
jgi:HSP20 family molecular chaperone IbpA